MAQKASIVPGLNQQLNYPGSNYASTYSEPTTNMLQQAIEYQVFDLASKQFDPLKLLNMAKMVEVPSDEFIYKSKLWSRELAAVESYDAGTKTITLTHAANYYDGYFPFAENTIIYTTDGTQLIVTATSTTHTAQNSATITVEAVSGGSVPGLVNGDEIAIQSSLKADGMDGFQGGVKAEFIDDYNFLQIIEHKSSWTRMELQKFKNLETTNAMSLEWEEKLLQTRLDLFSMFIAGVRGEYVVKNPAGGTLPAKTMNGIFPSMVDGGAPSANPTSSGLIAAFEALAFETNKQAIGGVRFVLGTAEQLYEIQKLIKEDGIRYTPNDRIANMELKEYQFGGMRFVFLQTELFNEGAGVLPSIWAKRILCLDMATVNRVKMKGIPHIEMFKTNDVTRGSENDATSWVIRATMSLKMNQIGGSFYIDVQ